MPALALDSGELVTEGPVIVQMIADKAADKNLAPARDRPSATSCWNGSTSSPPSCTRISARMFAPVLADDAKAFFKDRVMGKFKYVDGAARRAATT